MSYTTQVSKYEKKLCSIRLCVYMIFHKILGMISGPSDFGGHCPSPTYKYRESGIDYCCCSNACCWERCVFSTPPADCLPSGHQWIYSAELGYFQAFTSQGIFGGTRFFSIHHLSQVFFHFSSFIHSAHREIRCKFFPNFQILN